MKWFVGVALLLMAALFLESGLLAYAMYVMVGLLVISRLMARSWSEGLSASRECNRDTAEIGDKVAVAVTVRNAGKLPVPWVLLEDLLPGNALNQRAPRLKVKGKRLQLNMIGPTGQAVVRYQLVCRMRGYYQLGPLVMESGDLFGLHRRYRVDAAPTYLLVYPKIVPLIGYELASRRPIGDIRMTHRLYEDPTRIAGIRGYEAGDPLNRVHWRATARAGTLQVKLYEPSSLSGATILLDFHEAGYPRNGEPMRSELAVTTAASLANAVYELGQQVGLVSNGRDAVERIKLDKAGHVPGVGQDFGTRRDARDAPAMKAESERLQPVAVETRRGVEQLQRIRETLARIELTDGMTFPQLILEALGRLPRDATVIAVLGDAPIDTALSLGNLRRRGFAVTAVLVACEPNRFQASYARLTAEGIHDVRHLRSEAGLATLCTRQFLGLSSYYEDETAPAQEKDATENWMEQAPFEIDNVED
jgi:uncharacterized repeat protein (TIGR01451 family)